VEIRYNIGTEKQVNNKGEMRTTLKIFPILLCTLLLVGITTCSNAPKFKYESDATLQTLLKKEAPAYPETSFLIFSDTHIYAPILGTEGKAFQDYLAKDRKLLKESTEIMESVIEATKKIDAKFVIVPGDLTKDGELASHELAASYLSQLEASGKQVYVVPGNHDINNGVSYKYAGDKTEHVPNITPAEFVKIYGEFGYKEALQRDPASLSYFAEPQAGLWLLALDSCRYAENKGDHEPITDGKMSTATLQWIEEMLIEAATKNKAVIAVMHHGMVEHYRGQEKNYGEYIVDDYQAISKLLAMCNVRLAFTGHYHAQDITLARWHEANKFVFDIETGSLVTYPNPYRVVKIDASQKATISSYRIQATHTHPDDFQKYSLAYTRDTIKGIAKSTIQGYKVDSAEAEDLAQQVAEAFVAHQAGDEKLPPEIDAIRTQGLSLPGWFVVNFRKDLVQGLWNDLEPPDNNINIDLKTGKSE
jgi:hypothetical protein